MIKTVTRTDRTIETWASSRLPDKWRSKPSLGHTGTTRLRLSCLVLSCLNHTTTTTKTYMFMHPHHVPRKLIISPPSPLPCVEPLSPRLASEFRNQLCKIHPWHITRLAKSITRRHRLEEDRLLFCSLNPPFVSCSLSLSVHIVCVSVYVWRKRRSLNRNQRKYFGLGGKTAFPAIFVLLCASLCVFAFFFFECLS